MCKNTVTKQDADKLFKTFVTAAEHFKVEVLSEDFRDWLKEFKVHLTGEGVDISIMDPVTAVDAFIAGVKPWDHAAGLREKARALAK